MHWFRKAAEQDDAAAQNILGYMYQEGRGVEANDGEAVKWFTNAAEQDYPSALTSLGWMYQEGRGVEPSDAKAIECYRRAADEGNAAAQNNLGGMYEQGRGVERDVVQAVEWYRQAAAGKLDENGNLTPGAAFAQHNLGTMYQDGRHGRGRRERYTGSAKPRNRTTHGRSAVSRKRTRVWCRAGHETPIFWYSKAAEFGDPDAEESCASW